MKVVDFTLAIGLLFILLSYGPLWWYVLRMRRTLKGLKNPVLWLPRDERRQHARMLLHREQVQYDLKHQDDVLKYINGKPLN